MRPSKASRARRAGTVAGVALLVGACGGTSPRPRRPAPAAALRHGRRAQRRPATPGPPVTIEYAIWGDPAEINQPDGGRRGLHGRQPEHQGRRHGVRLGRVLGQAPDRSRRRRRTRRVRDGRPAVPRLPVPRRAAGPHAVHRARRLRPRPAGRQRGQPTSPPPSVASSACRATSTSIALYYNKAMFDAAGIPYPDDTWDLGQARRGRQAADQGHRRRRHNRPVGLLHRDDRHGELLVSSVWQNGGDILAPDGTRPCSEPIRPRRASSSSRTSSTRTRSCPTRRFRRDRRRVRAGQGGHGVNGSWLVPTHEAAGINLGIAPLPAGSAGQATSVNPTGAVVYKGTKAPDASWEFVKYLASPAAQEQLMQLKASAARQQGGPRRPLRVVLRRGQGVRRLARLRAAQAVVPGYNEFRRRSRPSWTRTCSTPPTRRRSRRWGTLSRSLHRPRCRVGAALEPDGPLARGPRPQPPSRSPPAAERVAFAPGEGRWVLLFLAPTLVGLTLLSAGSHRGRVRDQPDQVGPAHPAPVRGDRQLRGAGS